MEREIWRDFGNLSFETKSESRKKFSSQQPPFIRLILELYLNNIIFSMKYGFITYQKVEHAYAAIDSSAKDSNISHYDVSFGGRRAFCRADYCDLGEFFIILNFIIQDRKKR